MMRWPFIAPVVTLLIAALALASVAAVCGQPDDERDLQSLGVDEETIAVVTETATETPIASETPAVDTATPEALATVEPSPTRELAQFPTPSSSSDTMLIGGNLWVDARPASGEVLAFISGKQCGRGQSGVLLHSALPSFVIEIASDAELAGCGTPGAAITLTVDGRAMNDLLEWRPGFQQPGTWVAGPAFARYGGSVRMPVLPYPRVVPYVGGVICGEQISGSYGENGWSYHVIVDPEELAPECGRPGSEVTFRLEVDGHPEMDLGTSVWSTERLVNRPATDLTARFATTPVANPEVR